MSSLKKRSAVAFAWDIGGTFFRQGSSFVISIFLARLLEPAEFGLVGMAMVFIGISQVFIDIGFTAGLIQNKNNTNLIYNSVFILNIAAGTILTITFYWAAPLIGIFYENTAITELVRWLSLLFILNSLNIVQQSILQKALNFKVLTIRLVVASLIGGIAGVYFAFQGYGVYALVIQQLGTSFVATVLIWVVSDWRPKIEFSLKEIKKIFSFSSYIFFDGFVSNVFQRLDILLIGKVFSPATLGFYTRAMSLQDIVIKYSSTSLIKVFYPVLSSIQDENEQYERVYFKVISVISFLSFLITGILYILGSDIIVLLFGSKWKPSIPIFQVLVLGICTYPINSMIVNAFKSKGKSKENFTVGLFRKAVRLVPLGFAFFVGIYEFTVAVVVTYYLLTVSNIFFLKKYTGLSIKEHIRKLVEGIIPLIAIILLAELPYFSETISRLLLALFYGIAYLVYNHLLQQEGYVFLLMNLKKKLNAL